MDVNKWITEIKTLCKPKDVYLCDGSDVEFKKLCQQLVESKTFIPLNPDLRPESYLARSHPDDTARVEQCTFICSEKKEDAGPTNNWEDPKVMRTRLSRLFDGCMRGRTMYIIPFCMGPFSSPLARLGIEITDSPYVAASMHLMTRMGEQAFDEIQNGKPFVPCVHSVGVPLDEGQKDIPWPCRPEERWIVHFPETKEIWSFGSGYGGNALLGKKSLALRIASVLAREQGWLAEHMLIVGITNPKGEKHYIAGAFPSACGKTNLAMLQAALPDWKIECVGDDIAWMAFGKDGRLYAINPERGFFGVAPGTSMKSNPNAMQTIKRKTVFTNVALTKEGDIWWQGMNDTPPGGLIDWQGASWDPASGKPPAHPNSRFTVSITQCPVLDPAWDEKQGVPISAILFGARRSDTMPLIFQSFSWEHGVFLGAGLSSEMTAAAKGEMGKLRNDPFAMLPFCGYNMADYWQHWFDLGKNGKKMPLIFQVNWFRKDASGKFLWPGFGDNIRVIDWIFERLAGRAQGEHSPLGIIPKEGELHLEALDVSWKQLFAMDKTEIRAEIELLKAFFAKFGNRLPKAIEKQLLDLEKRV
jgi:phosphoenolpyruvate carboxykinase (GTP)